MNRFDPHLGLLLERAGRAVGERLDRAFGRDGVTSDHETLEIWPASHHRFQPIKGAE